MKQQRLIIGIGELLWDILPAGRRAGAIAIEGLAGSTGASFGAFLGGAPANFTVMAGRLGDHAVLLSRIGRDALGREAIDQLDPLPVDASAIQIDLQHPTGQVTVDIASGEPKYQIQEQVAWDYLKLTDEWIQLAERADAICFGSLAQRRPESRQAIQTLAAETSSTCIRVFDVNLRAPHYSNEIVQESLELATALKLNETEMPVVLNLLGLHSAEEPNGMQLRMGAERLLREFPSLELVAVTRGKNGSLLVRRDEWNEHPGLHASVVDPVGCGDAFTAALTHYMLRGASLARLNEAGNRWGAWVASQAGAMPALPEDVHVSIAAAIESH